MPGFLEAQEGGESMRAFLAIELDDKTRQLLRDIQEKLKEAGVRGNYSLPDNLHLTVKFLSEINEAQVKKVRR